MEEFKPKRKNNNYSGTDKAGAPRRAPRQNHQNKPPQENSTPANKPRRRPARPAAAEAAQAPAQSVPAPRPRRPRNTPQGGVRLHTSSAAAASLSRITMPPTTR